MAVRGVQVRGRLASRLRAGRAARAEDEDLAAIAAAWGGQYSVGVDDGTWHASCLSGAPLPLTAKTAAELTALIQADWIRRGAAGGTP